MNENMSPSHRSRPSGGSNNMTYTEQGQNTAVDLSPESGVTEDSTQRRTHSEGPSQIPQSSLPSHPVDAPSPAHFPPQAVNPVLPVTEGGLARLRDAFSTYQSVASPLRHLASVSSFSSIPSVNTAASGGHPSHRTRTSNSRVRNVRQNIMLFGDQRHPGTPQTRIGRIVETPEGSEDEGQGGEKKNGESGSKSKRFSANGSLASGKTLVGGTGSMTKAVKSLTLSSMKRETMEEELRARPATGLSERKSQMREDEVVKEQNYPKAWQVPILIIGICLSIFLISLDRTIITTAIPQITAEFKSYNDIGWYGSSYLLTACAFQPLYGRIYQLFNIKYAFLGATLIFELGSLICGVAPNSVVLIVGRAVAGLGSAGILTGSFVVVAHSVPLQSRPVYTAAVGMMFGLGAVTGPLLGGVFTDLVSWRWCFYFNLPTGGATIIAMIFLFNPNSGPASKRPILERVSELDLIGNAILLGAAVMLFLGLQYAESQYAWSSARVAGLLAGSGSTFAIFAVWQWWKDEWALIPPRIIRQRSILASCAVAFFIYGALLIHSYYLPIWFQAVKDNSAIRAGVNMIGYMVSNAVLSLLAGIVVSKTGYFTPPCIIGCAIATVGCGLLTMLDERTSSSAWIGYEILVSAGLGMAIQQGFTAVQATLPLDEVPIGTAAVVAFQSLGGSIFVSVGNTILQTRLRSGIRDESIPGVDAQEVIDAGASMFRSIVPAESIQALITVYNSALQRVFLATIPLAGLAMAAACFLEWKSIKAKAETGETADAVDSV